MEENELQQKLADLYARLRQLKAGGVKMKDIAAETGWQPSALSSLYATVLPNLSRYERQGMSFTDALTRALGHVNNLSRKKLQADIDLLYRRVMDYALPDGGQGVGNHLFLNQLKAAAGASSARENHLEGMYMSYSCSSSMKALKAEPYYLTDSEANGCITVGRRSVHGSLREGIGVLRKQQMLYLLFNAFEAPNLSLVSVYLQVPFLEDISLLKGLYLVPDYNMNPIARRIVLLRRSDHYDAEAFAQMEARLVMPHELTDEESLIYAYTCGRTDYIKMCTLPSPKLDLRDLQAEKNLLLRDEEAEEAGRGGAAGA